MPHKFKTVVRRARFEVTGYSADAMTTIAGVTRDSIETRILRAQDTYDSPVKPLAKGYAKFKGRKGLAQVRDWRFTGRTLRSMKVLRAQANKAVIGFTDAVSNMRAAINNRRARQFGMSDTNRAALVDEAKRHPFMKVKAG